MTSQREREVQAVAWHNKADAPDRMIRDAQQRTKAYRKYARRMARNNERAHERNSH